MSNTIELAFPVVVEHFVSATGLTKREYFAAIFMHAMMPHLGGLEYDYIAKQAAEAADAFIHVLERKPK